MDDTISRQAVKELAHNQVREKYCGMALKEHRDFYIKLADSIIDLLPSVQPDIIRCKDCAWWTKQEASMQGRCALLQMYPTGEWFCGNAERREVTE